jgi:hypothetical protein
VAGGSEFGGGELGSPARNPAKRRRLRAIPVNSLGGEEEGGDVDLLSSSERQGEARNGGLRRQPWRSSSSTGSVFTGEREGPRGKKEGGQGRDKEEEEEASRCCSTESSRPRLGKHEVAGVLQGQDTHLIHCAGGRKQRNHFAKNPLAFWGVFWKFLNNTTLHVLMMQTCSKKNMKINRGFPVNY